MRRLCALLLLFLAAMAGIPNPGAQSPAARPNILVIITDDQPTLGLDRFMPDTMRWLRDTGVTLPNAYASTPSCCPARASIMSGRYAHNHGVRSNGGSEEPSAEAFNHSTAVQRYLQEAGYRTGIVGKFLNGWGIHNSPPFWDFWSIKSGDHRNTPWNVNGDYQLIPTYNARFVGRRASRFIETSEAKDMRPWMLYVAPSAPHGPWDPQRRYEDAPVNLWNGNPAVAEEDRSDKPPWLQNRNCTLSCGQRIRTGQARLIMSVDDLVQRLRGQLSAYDEANTLLIYISDNGYFWGEHGLKAKAQPYLQSTRVPLMMRWPGRVDRGTVDERFALNVDIAPTILEAAGVPVETTVMDGRSLLVGSARNRVHLEYWCNTNVCDRWASTRTHEYQYIERYDETGRRIFREYYDLTEDPWQLRNVFHDGRLGNGPNDPASLQAQLQADRTCAGASCP